MANYYIENTIQESDLFFPFLLINDVVQDATVTASEGAPDNVKLLTTYNRWVTETNDQTILIEFSVTSDIDYVACYVTNQASTDFLLEYYDGADWVEIGTTIKDNFGCCYWLFDELSIDKIRITSSAVCEVAVIKSGLKTQIPVGLPIGYKPALFNQVEKLTNAVSVSGHVLGTQIEGSKISESLSFDLIDPDFIKNTFASVRQKMRTHGIFLVWNASGNPEQVVYGVLVGDVDISYSKVNTMKIAFKLEGAKHDY